MVFTNTRKLILGGTLSALFVAGGVYASTAFAQSTPASTSPSVSASASASASPSARGAGARQTYLQHLAQHLNISVDQLQSAMKAAAHDGVADALKAGRITQDQANQINQRIDSGQGPAAFGRGIGRGPKPNGANGSPRAGFAPGQALNAAAQALNMQPSDLMSQLRQGKSLADIAKAQNVDLAKVTAAVTGTVKPQLDQAVQNGRLTQQQETDILNRISSGQFPGPGRFGPRPNRSAAPSPSASASASA